MNEDVKLIKELLDEGKGYLAKGNPIQASENLYKVVEECIKLLAQRHKIPEYREAGEEGRWWTRLLSRAARTLARLLEEGKIEDTWARAFDLHVWGFHEKALRVGDIEQDITYVEWLMKYTEKAIEQSPPEST
jgi:hypothetical protein